MFPFPGDRVGRRVPASIVAGAIVITMDGGTSVLTTGVKGYMTVPISMVLTECIMVADESGSIVVDIWKCTYAQFDAGSTHPLVADTITASDLPTISSATKSDDALLTGWNTQLNAGDILAFNINSVTSIKRLSMTLKGNWV